MINNKDTKFNMVMCGNCGKPHTLTEGCKLPVQKNNIASPILVKLEELLDKVKNSKVNMKGFVKKEQKSFDNLKDNL